MRPHQVALPACRCLCHNFLTMHVFCNGEELIVVVHALPLLCHNDVDMTVFRSPSASTPRNSASAHCSAAFSNHFVASTGPPAQRNAGDGRASSETSTLEVFQHFSRFKNSFRGLFDKCIDALDASTHLKNIHEAVVKHAVGLVR